MLDDDDNRVKPGARDWIEDMGRNPVELICHECGQPFKGHSTRKTCMVCRNTPPPNPSRTAYSPYR